MPESPEKEAFTITVGTGSFKCRHGRVTTAINQPDKASGSVPAEDMARSPTDWAAPTDVAVGSHVLTSGRVVEALPESDGSVALSVRSATALDESLMPPMVCQNLEAQEIVYAAARSAGFATADIHIHGLDDLPSEPMWVVAPIDGLRLERTVRVGDVEFMDAAAGQEMLQRFSPPLAPVFSDPLAEASAFARVAVVARVPYDAEEERLGVDRHRGGLADDPASLLVVARARQQLGALPASVEPRDRRAPQRRRCARR